VSIQSGTVGDHNTCLLQHINLSLSTGERLAIVVAPMAVENLLESKQSWGPLYGSIN